MLCFCDVHAYSFMLTFGWSISLLCSLPCLHACIYAFAPRSMFPHACVLGSMLSTCFTLFSMCLCVPCHVSVPRPRPCLSCHVLLKPLCRFIFLSCVLAYCFGPNLDQMVLVIVHTPRPTSKGLDHPFCVSMLACFYTLSFVLAFLVLGFAMFGTHHRLDLVWLHPMPMRPCLGVIV